MIYLILFNIFLISIYNHNFKKIYLSFLFFNLLIYIFSFYYIYIDSLFKLLHLLFLSDIIVIFFQYLFQFISFLR